MAQISVALRGASGWAIAMTSSYSVCRLSPSPPARSREFSGFRVAAPREHKELRSGSQLRPPACASSARGATSSIGKPIWRNEMAGAVEKKLRELGIELPHPAAPSANYVPFVRTGNLLMVSGQICLDSGKLVAKGQLGGGVSIEDGQKAARACAVNLLAQVKAG